MYTAEVRHHHGEWDVELHVGKRGFGKNGDEEEDDKIECEEEGEDDEDDDDDDDDDDDCELRKILKETMR